MSESNPMRNDADFVLEFRDVADLKVPAKPLRKHRAADLKRLTRAVQEVGLASPIVIDETGMVIDGCARLEVAKRLGMSRVPVAVAPSGLTVGQKAALGLALNRMPERAVWDDQSISAALELVLAGEVPVELTGFDAGEIDRLLSPRQADIGADPDDVVEEPQDGRGVSQEFDIWKIGDHVVYHGNATDPGPFCLSVCMRKARSRRHRCGRVFKFVLSASRPRLMNIPKFVWHADYNFSSEEVRVINFPTIAYDHSNPDKYRLPLDTDLIPYDFGELKGW